MPTRARCPPERLARQGFYLPNGLTIGSDQIAEVAAAVRECLA